MPEIIFFKTQKALRVWFTKNHKKCGELVIGYYKKASGMQSVTYQQALEEALCVGWIDGIVRRIDEESYCQRFTPRRKGSIWSAVNIAKVSELEKRGLMKQAGLKTFNERDPKKANLYSFEQKNIALGKDYEKIFKSNKTAWEKFSAMPAGYRKTATWWVISAKQEETRLRRLNTLIADSEAGIKIKELRGGK